MSERPYLCEHHRGVFRTLDTPNGETPVMPLEVRDQWADQIAGQCCDDRPAPTAREETQ